jgi:hypothetical protein
MCTTVEATIHFLGKPCTGIEGFEDHEEASVPIEQ